MNNYDYTNLEVWNKSMELVENIYSVTNTFPKEEMYSLTNQIRRAAISIPSNIAEGQSRKSSSQFRYFLDIAQGSRGELETQIRIANRLGYIEESSMNEILELSKVVAKMLCRLRQSVAGNW